MNRWMSSVSLASFLLAGGLAAGGAEEVARPDLVEKVRSGELKEARVSWWGFDRLDSTRFVQAAISSRVPRLIVDKMKSPWYVRPLTGVSDQEIVFEKDCVMRAKRGEFKERGDSLLTLRRVANVKLSGYGATLSMWRSDYHDRSMYEWSEWRHAVNIESSSNITIEGLTISESGGDGIYIGICDARGRNPVSCSDIVVRDVLCDRNYRQGISVISARNLLIENTVMRDTWGTPPAAGIDFEPNNPNEHFVNCVMRNCRTEGNQGSGYEFAFTRFDASTHPVSIRLENCTSVGDMRCVHVDGGLKTTPKETSGTVEFVDCTFSEGLKPSTVKVFPTYSTTLVFDRCRFFDNCVLDPTAPEFANVPPYDFEPAFPFVRFKDCAVRRRAPGDWLMRLPNGDIPRGYEGTVFVRQGKTTDRIELRRKDSALPPYVRFDPAAVEVVDDRPGELLEFRQLPLRGKTRLVFHADRARTICIRGRREVVGKGKLGGNPFIVRAQDGTELTRIAPPGEEPLDMHLAVPAKGFYTLECANGKHVFHLMAADVPIAIDTNLAPQNFLSATGSLYLFADKSARFVLLGCGEGTAEGSQVGVFDPDGNPAAEKTDVIAWTVIRPREGPGGLWRVDLAKPSKGRHEDHFIDALGVVAHWFPTTSRYWKPRR